MSPGEITGLLQAVRKGDSNAASKLIPLVYAQLRRLAASYLRRERPDHTYRARSGEWQGATQHFDQMLATSRMLGDRRSNANALQGHAMVEYFRGAFTRSLQLSISFHSSALLISEKRFDAEAIR
jgi:hypothetical protein